MEVMNIVAPSTTTANTQSNVQQSTSTVNGTKDKDNFTSALNRAAEKSSNVEQKTENQNNMVGAMNNLTAAIVAAAAKGAQTAMSADETQLITASPVDNLQIEEESTETLDTQTLTAVMAVFGAQPLAQGAAQITLQANDNTEITVVSTIAASQNTKDSKNPFLALQEKVLGAAVNVLNDQTVLDTANFDNTNLAAGQTVQNVQPEVFGVTEQNFVQETNVSTQNLPEKPANKPAQNIPEKAVSEPAQNIPEKAVSEPAQNIFGKVGINFKTHADTKAIEISAVDVHTAPVMLTVETKEMPVINTIQAKSQTEVQLASEDAVQEIVAPYLEASKTSQSVSLPIRETIENQISSVVQAETSQSGEEQSFKEQSDQHPTMFSNILMHHSDKPSPAHSTFMEVHKPHDAYNVAGQIVEHARLIKQPLDVNNSEMLIKLRPDYLGELTLKIAVENGVVSASFHTNNAEVRSIIESSLPQLKQELASQGLKVDNVDVQAGLGDFFSDNQSQQEQLFRQQQQQQSTKLKNLKSTDDFVQAVEENASSASTGADGVDYRV